MDISSWKNQAKQALAGNVGAHAVIAQLGNEQIDGSDHEANLLLGILYGQTGRLDLAVEHLRQSLIQDQRNPDAIFFLGCFDALRYPGLHKSWAIRRDHAKNALRLVENTPQAAAWPQLKVCLEILATAASYVGPPEDAEFAYRWLIKIDPANADHYAKLSQLRADDDLEEAVALIDHARTLNPAIVNKTDVELSRKVLSDGTRRKSIARAKYPSTREMRGDLSAVIRTSLLDGLPKQRFIDKETRFFTLGSCFAREIAVRLIERGYQADFFEVVEHINSSFANRKMVDWALGQCTGQSKERLDELFASLNITPENLRVRLATAKVFVYTLGVAPAFFDRQSGEFVMPSSSALGSRAFAEMYDFRTTTVGQNLDNLDYIVANIKALNPDVKVVLTVSPVPLKTTFEFKSAIQADCISKSTLRVVAHEFVTSNPDVIYWPSFEIVRWLGGHVGPFYGNDDDAALHVGDHVVKAITDSFIEHFS
ncbi:GSCFA domain-containing protein [Burkholderia vietnamiensis]|uniref:GSCFA domain-containing protein n=1 Tax=Burkholderia vietnamiensis TaxID=60552 RepID=UPI001CB05968|nr:GSCFA domain-containing protein [Burkholderia vietnamiensis]CAG9212459.1 GSCFA domain-containing protein [Burkholderia vietnamiensis]